MDQSFGSGPCSKGELVRVACSLKGLCKVLGNGAGNQSSEEVSDYESADCTGGLLESYWLAEAGGVYC